MKRIMIVLAMAAVAQPHGAYAEGSPPWAERARRLVVRVQVPLGTDKTSDGIGFLVGSHGQQLYLVTASHVVWPDRPRFLPEDVTVQVQVKLADCDLPIPATASSAQASPVKPIDVALLRIDGDTVSGDVKARCHGIFANLSTLPRLIVDPDDVDHLAHNASLWVIARGKSTEWVEPRFATFDRIAEDKLQLNDQFHEGDSGSPVFSDQGHLVGMVVTDNGKAEKFSAIRDMIERDWDTPTNLAGKFSWLSFRGDHARGRLSIAGWPDVPLVSRQPAPLGEIELKLRLGESKLVTGMVNSEEGTMDCGVQVSHFLARHKRAAMYTMVGLAAAFMTSVVLTKLSEDNFEQSPSAGSYGRTRLLDGLSIGIGSAAVGALAATIYGHARSDIDLITCRKVSR